MRARVVGLGLIGGSIALALRRAGWTVSYVDPNVSLDDALAAGAIDEADDGGSADIALLATPLDVALDVLPRQSSLAMSVCSVMKPLRDAAGSRRFVAGHPLAGKSVRGLAAASADLFAGKRWFIDRDDATAKRVIADCGAEAVIVDAAEHDAAVAVTSHLPQVLSTALAAYIGEQRGASGEQRDLLEFAGSGLETFLRLASSDASVWTATIEANRTNIESHLDGVMRIVRQIIDGDAAAFAKARALMKRISETSG
jgi:prephenate dehydrogenase